MLKYAKICCANSLGKKGVVAHFLRFLHLWTVSVYDEFVVGMSGSEWHKMWSRLTAQICDLFWLITRNQDFLTKSVVFQRFLLPRYSP